MNVLEGEGNQPSDGTEFSTYGHYGSTFWDSSDGEILILNICDDCLRDGTDRLAQQKRYIPIFCEGIVVGRQWVDRPIVPYTGNEDDTRGEVSVEEVGIIAISNIEWIANLDDVKRTLMPGEEADG